MTEPFIMLVDDEIEFVETMAKRLAKKKIKVIKAFESSTALEMLAAHEDLDVVVLDVKMPGMNGIDALKEIKAVSPLTEVIMLTGHGTIESAIDAMRLGAYDFLKKPCDFEELVGKIAGAMQKKRSHEEKINTWQSFMTSSTLADLMVPLSEYAIVLEDASIIEAINALEKAQRSFDQKRYRHRAVLVRNRQGKIVGKLSQHDIIQALEPEHKESQERQKGALSHFGFGKQFIETVSMQFSSWDKPLQNLYAKAFKQKVKSFMYQPTEGEYIDVSASMDDTIHQMIVGHHHSLLVTDGADIVGVVRLTDVFEFIRLRLETMQIATKKDVEQND